MEIRELVIKNKRCLVNFDIQQLSEVSEECVDLMKSMLEKDPELRISKIPKIEKNKKFMKIVNPIFGIHS